MTETKTTGSPVSLKDLSFPLDITLVVMPDGVLLVASEGMMIWNDLLETHNFKINLTLPIQLREHIMKLREAANIQ